MKQILLIILVLLAAGCSRFDNQRSEVLYSEITPKVFRERIKSAPIAYLPLGTLEWHGEHLPLGSDGLQSSEFLIRLAQKVGGIVLPMLFLGPDTMLIENNKELYGMDFYASNSGNPFFSPQQQLDGSAYQVADSTFKEIIEAVLKQLQRAGFKIVVAHGHGPSTVFMIRHYAELENKYNLLIYTCWGWNVRGEYDQAANEKEHQDIGIMVDHAAANETSLMMYYLPHLVHLDLLPADTTKWPVGIMGRDPRLYASADVGKQATEWHLKRMEGLLAEALKKIKY